MDELKALPDHLLNLDDEIDEVRLRISKIRFLDKAFDSNPVWAQRFISKHSLMTTTSVGGKIGTVVSSVKNDLTRSLGMQIEDALIFRPRLSNTETW